MTTRRALLFLLALFPGAVGCQERDRTNLQPPAAAAQAAPRPEGHDASLRTAIVDAVGKVAPAVVSIRAVSRRQVTETPGFFDFFFIPREREQRAQSFGTGFAVNRRLTSEAETERGRSSSHIRSPLIECGGFDAGS